MLGNPCSTRVNGKTLNQQREATGLRKPRRLWLWRVRIKDQLTGRTEINTRERSKTMPQMALGKLLSPMEALMMGNGRMGYFKDMVHSRGQTERSTKVRY